MEVRREVTPDGVTVSTFTDSQGKVYAVPQPPGVTPEVLEEFDQ